MNYWKEHMTLRTVLMLLFFVGGLALTIIGWKMTGQMKGLGIMLVGLVLLLATLFLYNKPFQDKKDKRK